MVVALTMVTGTARHSLSVIAHVATHVVRESVRDKVFSLLVVFAMLLVIVSVLLGPIAAGQDIKIIKDLALGATHVFGLLMAVFIGIRLVATEVERRSIYALLSKPVRRHEVILGKYGGLLSILALHLSIMTLVTYAVLGYRAWGESDTFLRGLAAPPADPALLKAFVLIFMQLTVMAAVALLFSTFSTSFLSATLTMGIYVAGHFTTDLRHFDRVVDAPLVPALAHGLSYVLPDLASFDVKAAVVHGQPVPGTYVGLTAGYGLLYAGAVLVVSLLVFARRDLA